jgi:lactoylglutathione lyase
MRLAYTIFYSPNVAESLTFMEAAFGLQRRFMHEGGDYGELDTGATTLAFAAHSLGISHFPKGFVRGSESSQPLGMEIALTTHDVPAAHAKAIKAGAREMRAPETMPWGQTVSWVRCPDGLLVELCTPMG